MYSSYTKHHYAVLQNLRENKGQFRQVRDILGELGIRDPEGSLSGQIDRDLYRDRLVVATEEDGVMIVGKGESALSEFMKNG